MEPRRIIVAIPAYNCEKQIPRVIREFNPPLLNQISEVVIFDNVSSDGTVAAAQKAIEEIPKSTCRFQLIRNPQNLGLGGTHKAAFRYAIESGADWVAILHGDHQAKTEELADLLNEAERRPSADAILGARFMPQSRLNGYSRLRTVGNQLLNLAYTVLCGKKTYDLGSGINLFRISALKRIPFESFSDQFTFNMDLLLSFYFNRIDVQFFPITWNETDQVSNAKTFRVGWMSLKTLLRWRFGHFYPS